MTGCKGSMYEKSQSNFTEVTTVKAANFEVPSGFLMKATAISSISESEEYNGIYVYKDGESRYILFDTSSVVIACGPTQFNFKDNESEETLTSKSIEGIWMTSDDGKPNFKSDTNNGVYKIIATDLDAQFSITPTQYCTLKGEMASCSDGEVEYSIFAGAVLDADGSLTKDQQDIISHIVKNFSLSGISIDEKETSEEPATEAKEGTEQKDEKPEVEEPAEEPGEEEITVENETTSEEAVAEETQADNEQEESSEQEVKEETSESADEKVEDDNNEVIVEVTEEDTEEVEETPIVKQKKLKPKKSTAYKPLSLDDWGYASTIDKSGENSVMGVHIDNIYTKEEATKLIQQYGGRKTTSTEGTSFVVVEYSTTVSEKDAYLNLRFCGVDGGRLVLRGVSYTTRAYDLDNTEQLGSGYDKVTYAHRYAYYEVPTGCKEYMLVFGENIKEVDDEPQANFLIKQ